MADKEWTILSDTELALRTQRLSVTTLVILCLGTLVTLGLMYHQGKLEPTRAGPLHIVTAQTQAAAAPHAVSPPPLQQAPPPVRTPPKAEAPAQAGSYPPASTGIQVPGKGTVFMW